MLFCASKEKKLRARRTLPTIQYRSPDLLSTGPFSNRASDLAQLLDTLRVVGLVPVQESRRGPASVSVMQTAGAYDR